MTRTRTRSISFFQYHHHTMSAIQTISSPRCWFASAAAGLILTALPATACKVKAIFVQPPVAVPEKAVLFTVQKSEEIELPQRNLSVAVELPAGDLTVAVLPEKPTQSEIPAGAPKIKIPEAWTSCILLFFHDPANSVFPARVIPVNTSAADFPLGQTVMFNVSTATILAKFGSEIIRVNPGQSGTVKPSSSEDGNYLVAIDCAYPGDKEPIAVCRSTWPLEENARQIMFVTPVPDQKVPRVWSVLDRAQDTSKKGK